MEVYNITVKDKEGEMQSIAYYYVYTEKHAIFAPSPFIDEYKDIVPDPRMWEQVESKTGPVGFIAEMIKEENRETSTGRRTYVCGPYVIERESKRIGDDFMVYACGAKNGEAGYSAVSHSVPHEEVKGIPTGIDEWVRHYSFHKMDDGTYEAELDEAWYWGGSHEDGGTIVRPVPDEWFSLTYEQFLENVLTLCSAAHYRFTVEELLSCKGLESFFGFK